MVKVRKLAMLGVFRILLLGTTVAVSFPMAQIALAAPATSLNADGLLRNMHRSLATVLVGYKSNQGKPARGDALVLEAANHAASDLAGLEKAFKDRNARAVSNATERLAVSVGRLEAVARSVSLRNPTVAEGVRAVSANWATYTARYALARNKHQSKATPKQVDALNGQVARLDREVRNLRQRVAANERLAHDVDGLVAQVDLIQRRGVTVETYQETLLVLISFRGWVGGYTIVTPVYYPEYRQHFVVFEPEIVFVDSYWDGYYDAYYESVPWAYYDDRFDPPEAVNINVDVTIQQDIDVYVDQDITVVVDGTASVEADLTRIEAQSSDVTVSPDQRELRSAATEAVAWHDAVAPATIGTEPGEVAPSGPEKTQTDETSGSGDAGEAVKPEAGTVPDDGPAKGEKGVDDKGDVTQAEPMQPNESVGPHPEAESAAEVEFSRELKAAPKDKPNDEVDYEDEAEPAKATPDAVDSAPQPSDEAGAVESQPRAAETQPEEAGEQERAREAEQSCESEVCE
ncbi:hypothetical protein [Mesorhizobium sp. NPDC059025]|uniref:hypothetical protein n=1 Tax=unclassified Mesorhizobium TaxID=325217 RepID=UPI0036B0B791